MTNDEKKQYVTRPHPSRAVDVEELVEKIRLKYMLGQHDCQNVTIARVALTYALNQGYLTQKPEGMVLVPREPTEDMLNAGEKELPYTNDVYQAMIAQHLTED